MQLQCPKAVRLSINFVVRSCTQCGHIDQFKEGNSDEELKQTFFLCKSVLVMERSRHSKLGGNIGCRNQRLETKDK